MYMLILLQSNHRQQQQQEGPKQTHHVKFLEPRSGRGVRNPPPGKENAIHAGHTAGAAARSTESPATKAPPRGRVKGPLSKVSRPSSGSSASRDKLKSSKETHAPSKSRDCTVCTHTTKQFYYYAYVHVRILFMCTLSL